MSGQQSVVAELSRGSWLTDERCMRIRRWVLSQEKEVSVPVEIVIVDDLKSRKGKTVFGGE